eukprot:Phypoly_transcript_07652.p1 GENE.Phypoly_transcript_07652~~Phypoly_transcript_07652.p1  ORF type:complete len:463 (+),score=75.40 Phypoly_transcript_07652:44-1390(+)
MAKRLNIIHFNDVYEIDARAKDPVGGATRFAAGIKKYSHLNPIVLFSGDVFNPSVTSTVTKGKHMIPVMHQLKVQASVVGNHEFDFGPDVLTKYIKECKFPWLLSNVINKDNGEQLVGTVKTAMIDWEGVKVGIHGLAEKEWLDTVSNIDTFAKYLDFVTVGNELSKELRDQGADIVVCLAHMRMNNCEKLAAEVPGTDIILAGHDHFYELKKVAGKYIVLSGSDFRNFSVIQGSKENDKWEFNIEQVDIMSTIPEDPDMLAIVKEATNEVQKQMGKVLGTTSVVLDATNANSRTRETNLGDLVADVMQRGFQTDIAFINGGSIRSDDTYGPGDFTLKSLVSILPFPDVVVKIRITGQQLKSVLETSVSRYPAQDGRFLQIAGFSFGFNPEKPAGERVEWIKREGVPIDLNAKYVAATKAEIETKEKKKKMRKKKQKKKKNKKKRNYY